MPKLPAERIKEIGEGLLIASGAPPVEAETVMRHCVNANLAGHDSHGIIMIPNYIERVKVGHIVPGAPWKIVQESRRRRPWSMAIGALATWSTNAP